MDFDMQVEEFIVSPLQKRFEDNTYEIRVIAMSVVVVPERGAGLLDVR